ncbi:MAG: DNA sulfur modification protein DndD [Desulfovibrionaceae bacterium]|nr:DNA sulfur modification protein DndD [Desulfovibrionaceae bacterium]
MILRQLILENFSVYAGRQAIDLAPQNSEHPIVLIGGLNGAGKTSILTAVRLALFGKRVMQLSQDRISYSKFLRSLIHNKTPGHALIELEFSTYTLGRKDTYRINRAWEIDKDGKSTENITAWNNGQDDPLLAATWDDFIDALLPVSISHLFFFDGEKVSEMANEAGICTLLRTGIQALLGIDLLTKLQNDLSDLISKKSKAAGSDEDAKHMAILEKELQELACVKSQINEENSNFDDLYSDIQKELANTEEQFKEAGGHLFLERVNTEKELKDAKEMLAANNDELIDLAAGALPLALIPDLVQSVQEQDRREQDALLAFSMLSILEKRDRQALALLTDIPNSLWEQVSAFFDQDRSQRAAATQTEIYLRLDAEGREKLNKLDTILSAEKMRAAKLLQARDEIESRVADAEKRLSMTPPHEAVQQLLEERSKLQLRISNIDQKRAQIFRKLDECERGIAFREKERDRVLRHIASSQVSENVEARVVRYAQKARERVGNYSLRLKEKALGELEEFILDSVQQLFRKFGFVQRVIIDPEFYSLHLFGENGRVIPLDRLSAGERQLVVIAILWGLGRASGRPLPLIIDTPLGRLDSKHRDNMLDFYLPTASHQTILLATDAEITQADLPRLVPFLGGSHMLIYDDMTRSTVIKSGFFWSAA